MNVATLHEINIRGIEALKKVLEPLELVRFFQQYELGYGNYTEERRVLYKDYTVEKICNEIKFNKKNKKIL
jgi:hypothetical protein